MPSGGRYSMMVITLQLKQESTFYVANTLPVIVFLPLLAWSAAQEEVCKLADRMTTILALLLTMATYKISISSWIPQKDYLTFMDYYTIFGFMFIFSIGGIIGL